MKHTHKHKKGFTGLELLIVVGFIATATVTTYNIYNYASDKQKVNSEIFKLSSLRKTLENTFNSEGFSRISQSTLYLMGLDYKSEFKNAFIEGISKDSFKVKYTSLNSRQCTDLALKAIIFKKTSVKIGGDLIKNSPTAISEKCKDNFNTLDVVFESLESKEMQYVAQSPPKPAQIYAEEGTFIPALPPTVSAAAVSFAELVKPVEIPVKPVQSAYVKPVAIDENDNISLYPDSNPLYFSYPSQIENQAPVYGITTGQDTTNIRPIDPPIPPAPPALQRIQTGIYTFTCNVANNFNRYIFCLNSFYTKEYNNRTSSQGITINNENYLYDNVSRTYQKDKAFRAFGSRYITFNGLVYDVNELYKTHRIFYLSGSVFNDGDHYQGYLYGDITVQLCEVGKAFSYQGKNIQCI